MTTKICTKCHIEKPITEFHKDSGKKDGLRNDCKCCAKVKAKQHYNSDPLKAKDYNLNRYYGISLDQFNQMLKAQNGRCAICGTAAPGGKGTWKVDHCHNSNKVRALLCNSCNVGIGHLKHSISTLEKAILYLSNHYDDTSSSH